MEHNSSGGLGSGEIILRPATKITNHILMVSWKKGYLEEKGQHISPEKFIKIQTENNPDMP